MAELTPYYPLTFITDQDETINNGNPLTLPEILEQLFEYFSFISDINFLLELRLVCQTWNQEISRKLRKKYQLLINCPDSLENVYTFYNNNLTNSQLLPLQNCKIFGRWSMQNLTGSPSSLFTRFLDTYSQNICILHLDAIHWNLRDLEWFFHSVSFPNLSNLTLVCPNAVDLLTSFAFISPDTGPQLKSLRIFTVHQLKTLMIPWIIDLIQQNIYLEKFILKEDMNNCITRCVPNTLFQKIITMIDFNLNEFKLDYYISNLQLASLLKSLSNINVHNNNRNINSLAFGLQENFNRINFLKLLHLIQNSIIKLVISFEWIKDKFNLNSLQYPNLLLVKLATLKLNNLKCSFDWFVKYCPNLQCLMLNNFEGISIVALPFKQLKQLQTLQINYSIKCHNNCIEDIIYICPNLKWLSLKGKLNNLEVQLIIAKLDYLIELKLEPQKVFFDNQAFFSMGIACHEEEQEAKLVKLTKCSNSNQMSIGNESQPGTSNANGISICKQGQDDRSSCTTETTGTEETEVEGEYDNIISSYRKCICHLKDLRYLLIESNPNLTDSIFESIGHCFQLRKLTLKGARLTDKLLTALVNNLPALNELTFSSPCISHAAKQHAKEIIGDRNCDIKEMEVGEQALLADIVLSCLDQVQTVNMNCMII